MISDNGKTFKAATKVIKSIVGHVDGEVFAHLIYQKMPQKDYW